MAVPMAACCLQMLCPVLHGCHPGDTGCDFDTHMHIHAYRLGEQELSEEAESAWPPREVLTWPPWSRPSSMPLFYSLGARGQSGEQARYESQGQARIRT